MKKLFLILLFIFLVGCNDKESQQQTVNNTNDEVQTEQSDEEIENDGPLTEVGQINKKSDYTVELLAIKDVNETIDLDPIKLTIDDIKFIRMSNVSKDYRTFLNQFTDKETFDYIQIIYSMENMIDENVDFISPMSYLVLDTGEQIDVNINDFMLDPNNNSVFYGKVKKESGIAAIIDNSNVEDINTIKIITGFVMNEAGEILSEEKEITYELD